MSTPTMPHCEGCDHEVPTVKRYRVELAEGETIEAAWCADCHTIAVVDGDGIVSATEVA